MPLGTKGTPINVKENKFCISNCHYFNKRIITAKYPAKYTRSDIFFSQNLGAKYTFDGVMCLCEGFILKYCYLESDFSWHCRLSTF